MDSRGVHDMLFEDTGLESLRMTIKKGSFTKASEALDRHKSYCRYKVLKLEECAGVALVEVIQKEVVATGQGLALVRAYDQLKKTFKKITPTLEV